MIAFIRRAMDAERLAKRLDALEEENSRLKALLRKSHEEPQFQSVASRLPVGREVMDALQDKVIHDLAPFVKADAVRLLEAAFGGIRSPDDLDPITARAAMRDGYNLEARFTFHAAATDVVIPVSVRSSGVLGPR